MKTPLFMALAMICLAQLGLAMLLWVSSMEYGTGHPVVAIVLAVLSVVVGGWASSVAAESEMGI